MKDKKPTKVYDYKSAFLDDATYHVRIEVGHYDFDGSLCVDLYDVDNDEPFTTLTVCVPDINDEPYAIMGEDTAFVDTNNNPEAEEFIKRYKLGTPLGIYASSGFCRYPAYKFDLKKLGA